MLRLYLFYGIKSIEPLNQQWVDYITTTTLYSDSHPACCVVDVLII